MSYGSTQRQAGVPAPTDAGLSPTAATGLLSHDDPDAHVPAEAEGPELTPGTTTVWQKLKAFHERNFGLFLVFLAEIFASLVSSVPCSPLHCIDSLNPTHRNSNENNMLR